jgi:RHS repeat-associated protein
VKPNIDPVVERVFYYRARYYDPDSSASSARIHSGCSAGPNCYTYVGHNPINVVDRMGQERVADENVKKCMCWKAAN